MSQKKRGDICSLVVCFQVKNVSNQRHSTLLVDMLPLTAVRKVYTRIECWHCWATATLRGTCCFVCRRIARVVPRENCADTAPSLFRAHTIYWSSAQPCIHRRNRFFCSNGALQEQDLATGSALEYIMQNCDGLETTAEDHVVKQGVELEGRPGACA